ncbi:MAG: sulfatase-like hydrolase/transferase [Caldilineaceae bacterium]|nr:sulfatase-like hydrolase/transferase [Caldilineaceae bacterium]
MRTQRPNILVFICHDLGRYLGCYGVPGVRTPHIDAFAASGLLFENSFCVAPQCSPSRAALWTGRYPHANGVVGMAHTEYANDLKPDERHLAQVLAGHGYETRLFGVQHEASSPERCGYQHAHPRGSCAELADAFCGSLAQFSRPFFAQIGFFEPHRPFPSDTEPLDADEVAIPPYLPDIPVVREDLVDMEASIASIDKAFGRVLAALETAGLADDTVVVFTADHGIPFPLSKMSLYDAGIEVPLLMRIPGLGASSAASAAETGQPEEAGGRRFGEFVTHADFVPTVLEMLAIEPPPKLHGRSYWSLLCGDEYGPSDCVFVEKTYHVYYDPMRAIRTERWKLIANFEFSPRIETPPDFLNNGKSYPEISVALDVSSTGLNHPPFELFDLERDPLEQNNLAEDPDYAAIRDGLARRLRAWMEETEDPLLDGPMVQATYINRMRAFKSL